MIRHQETPNLVLCCSTCPRTPPRVTLPPDLRGRPGAQIIIVSARLPAGAPPAIPAGDLWARRV